MVDGASTDSTPSIVGEVARRDPRVRLLANPARVTPAALNVGLAAARGRFLVRVDAHAYPDRDYVERIVRHLSSGRYAGVGGRKVAVGGKPAVSKAVASALGSRFGVGGSKYHHVSRPTLAQHIPFGAYEVALLRRLGGWDERLLVNQDFELDYRICRAGGRLLLDPGISIRWKSSQTLRSFAHQYRRYGMGKATVARLHPRSLKPRHLLPVFGLGVVVSACAVSAALLSPIPLLAGAPYAAFLLAALGDSRFRNDGVVACAITPVVLFVMHMSWAWGFLDGLVRQTVLDRAYGDPFRARDLSQAVE